MQLITWQELKLLTYVSSNLVRDEIFQESFERDSLFLLIVDEPILNKCSIKLTRVETIASLKNRKDTHKRLYRQIKDSIEKWLSEKAGRKSRIWVAVKFAAFGLEIPCEKIFCAFKVADIEGCMLYFHAFSAFFSKHITTSSSRGSSISFLRLRYTTTMLTISISSRNLLSMEPLPKR